MFIPVDDIDHKTSKIMTIAKQDEALRIEILKEKADRLTADTIFVRVHTYVRAGESL